MALVFDPLGPLRIAVEKLLLERSSPSRPLKSGENSLDRRLRVRKSPFSSHFWPVFKLKLVARPLGSSRRVPACTWSHEPRRSGSHLSGGLTLWLTVKPFETQAPRLRRVETSHETCTCQAEEAVFMPSHGSERLRRSHLAISVCLKKALQPISVYHWLGSISPLYTY